MSRKNSTLTKVCVIGWPINHSRSPLIHNYWIKNHKIDALYEKIPVAPENLTTFLTTMRDQGYVGCNVTIPHKENAIASIDQPDHRVKRIGALNTIFHRDGKSCATSTDGEGFFQNLVSHVRNFSLRDRTVIILGAGGAARAIVDRLLEEMPATILIANRTPDRAKQIEQDFGPIVNSIAIETLPKFLPQMDLLVNTTSLGMIGHDPLRVDVKLLPKTAVVADIVYAPLKTDLIKAAENLGLRTAPGLGMLLHQAVRGFELWLGVKPEVTDELYDLVARDIDPEYQR